ncbi:HNH endonuclease family protein [Micromonospora sp. WMMD1102]|uniref:HNH endonuclease family protein n=1 Tax=Micromonospora sp. WMMD1102 TaxID=3016105 RepID=UPI0024150529|nr:HNH endonuclease family protein [Micromonospora sp. WMMD1102]MDG4785087.1 HNH endonuclease family protein [Micromonospora sp. WMMD1102]
MPASGRATVRSPRRSVPLYKGLCRAPVSGCCWRRSRTTVGPTRASRAGARETSRSSTSCPRAWREHWAAGVDDEQAAEHDLLLHTLGNLTLVNKKLNPALSNRPWTDEQAKERGLGSTGKRTELLMHATLKLNADLVRDPAGSWDEERIRARTKELAQAVFDIWPVPAGAVVTGMNLDEAERDPAENGEEQPTGGGTDGRYGPLTDWLRAQTSDEPLVSFDHLEDILGLPLPASARNHLPYWYSAGNALGKAVVTAGFKARGVNMTNETLVLTRTTPSGDEVLPVIRPVP